MALELPIAVYGNGDLYQELFNAIAAAFSDTAYGFLIKLSLCITGTWAIVCYSAQRSLMPLAKWLITYYFAFYVVFMPKVTVEILDQVNQGKAYTVDNIPLGLAAVANLTSSIGAGLTALTEKNFTLPDDLKYEKTGMVMASRLVLASTQFQVTNPNFQQSLQGFVHQCVFYDLLLNKYSWNDLLTATNIWNFVGQYASAARAFAYYQPGNTQIVTCKDGFTLLSNDWKNAISDAATRYGARLFPDAQDAKSQLLSYLPDSYQFLTNISDDAVTIMQQNMMANAFQEGILQMSASTNSPAALEAYAFTKAQQQKRLTNYTLGDMAAYWIPIMKNVLEATLYGSFIFIFLLLLFPFGPAIFKNYVASLMWVQLWAPLYAILNLFLSFYAQKHSLGALNLGNGTSGLTLSSQAGLAQVNADVAGLAGYLLLSVPVLAAGMVKGLMSVFTQAAQYIAGVTQGAASSAASDAVSGNLSLGNTNFSNHSAYNTSANHFDTNARVFGGMYTSQMPGGSTLGVSPDGSLIMNNQSAISNLATTYHISDSVRETAMRQAEVSQAAAIHYGKAYVTSTHDAARNVSDLAYQEAIGASSGHSYSVSLTGGTQEAVNNIENLTSAFAQKHGLTNTQAINYLASAYASVQGGVTLSSKDQLFGWAESKVTGLSVNASATTGVTGTAQHSSGHTYDQTFSDALNYVQTSGYSHNMDTALRGVAEQHYRTHDDESNRFMQGISNSYEQSVQARQDMQSNLNLAQSYREAATFAQEHADIVNTNGGQLLFEGMQGATQGNMREIEKLETENPEAAEALGNNLTQDAANQYLNNWVKTHPINSSSVQSSYESHNAQIPGQAAVVQTNQSNQLQVEAKAHEKDLGEMSAVEFFQNLISLIHNCKFLQLN